MKIKIVSELCKVFEKLENLGVPSEMPMLTSFLSTPKRMLPDKIKNAVRMGMIESAQNGGAYV